MFKLTPFNSSPRKRDGFVDFYDMFDDFFQSSPLRSLRHDTFKIDVEENTDSYKVVADLPGIERDDLKVSYDENTLTIAIEKTVENENKDEDKHYIHKERHSTSMKRSLYLPNLDPQAIDAKLENGVLTLEAKKQEVQNHTTLIDVK